MRIEATSVVTQPDGLIEVLVMLPDLDADTPAGEPSSTAPHLILIPSEAIGARMVLYDLDDPDDALEAILREHAVRLGVGAGKLAPAVVDPGDRAGHAGGRDERAVVTFEGASRTEARAVVAANAETISHAHDERLPPVADDASAP